MCREEIGWPHLTLRVNYKSNNSTNSCVIANTILYGRQKMAGWTATELEIYSSEPKERWGQEGPHKTLIWISPEIELHHRAFTSPWALFWCGRITKPWRYLTLGQVHVCCTHYSPALPGGSGGHPFWPRGILVLQEMLSFHSPWIWSLTTRRWILDGITTSPDWVLVWLKKN